MNYIFAPESVSQRKHIFSDVNLAIGAEKRLEMFQDMDEFSARLRRFNNPEIIIVLAVGKKDMPRILALRDVFLEAAVIMVLNDEDPATISLAIRMRPKFLGIMDADLDKILPIVKKLVQKSRNN